MITCPNHQTIANVLNGLASDTEIDATYAHVEQCETCATTLEKLERETSTIGESGLDVTLRNMAEFDRATGACEQMVDSSAHLIHQVNQSEGQVGLQIIRDYALHEQIGRGGMGHVYRATHQHLKRDVALKIISPTVLANDRVVLQFRQEIEAVGQLDHQNIVRALDAGEDDGRMYLAMELVQGVDLGRVVEDVGRLPLDLALEITRQTAIGLAEAHHHGLVHRDIKPSNLMLNQSGTIRILDFGLALLTGKHQAEVISFAGSRDFMAPEQTHEELVGSAADIYALGCTFGYLVTGNSPKRCNQQSGNRLPAPVNVPALKMPKTIRRLFQLMLSENPANRPEAHEVAAALTTYEQQDALKQLSARLSPRFRTKRTPGTHTAAKNASKTIGLKPTLVAALVAVLIGLTYLTIDSIYFGPSNEENTSQPELDLHALHTELQLAPLSISALGIWGRIEGEPVRIIHAPGRQMTIVAGSGPKESEFRAWDALAMRMKYEQAFDKYLQFSNTIHALAQQSPIETLMAFPLPKNIDSILIRGRANHCEVDVLVSKNFHVVCASRESRRLISVKSADADWRHRLVDPRDEAMRFCDVDPQQVAQLREFEAELRQP